MILTFNEIADTVFGSVKTEVRDGYLKFHRFTDEQEKFYENYNSDFYSKCFATAGVKMRFITDGRALRIVFKAEQASSRTFFSLDVVVNGKYAGSVDNFSDYTIETKYHEGIFPLGDFENVFPLTDGEKEVIVYFPWSVNLEIKEIELSGATFLRAVKYDRKALVFGDSITQGYDALRPYKRYAARFTETLGAEEINKAIGGETFPPELAAIKDRFTPDYISVAYGTNDWSKTDFEDFKIRCEKFFYNLKTNYPESRIFALTPIWRKDYSEKRHGWDFSEVETTLRKVTENYKNVTVIRCFDFVPKDERYFSDLRLHPNDEGFDEYALNLAREIKKYI